MEIVISLGMAIVMFAFSVVLFVIGIKLILEDDYEEERYEMDENGNLKRIDVVVEVIDDER